MLVIDKMDEIHYYTFVCYSIKVHCKFAKASVRVGTKGSYKGRKCHFFAKRCSSSIKRLKIGAIVHQELGYFTLFYIPKGGRVSGDKGVGGRDEKTKN